jgi:hypothetical protein
MRAAGTDLAVVLRRLARDAVAAQDALDELARTGAERWDDTGIPPWSGAYARLRADLRTGVGIKPGTGVGPAGPGLLVSSRRAAGRIAVSFALHGHDEAS